MSRSASARRVATSRREVTSRSIASATPGWMSGTTSHSTTRVSLARRHGPLALPRGARGQVEIGADHVRRPVPAQRLERRCPGSAPPPRSRRGSGPRDRRLRARPGHGRRPRARAARAPRSASCAARASIGGRHHVRDRLEEVDLVLREVARAAPGDEEHAVGPLLPTHRHGEGGGGAGRREQRVRETAVPQDVRALCAGALPLARASARERHHERDGVAARDGDAGGGADGERRRPLARGTRRAESSRALAGERGGGVEDVLDGGEPERELAHARERSGAAELGVEPQLRRSAPRRRRVTPRLRVAPARDDVRRGSRAATGRAENSTQRSRPSAQRMRTSMGMPSSSGVERGAGEAREVLLAHERPGVLADHLVGAEARRAARRPRSGTGCRRPA